MKPFKRVHFLSIMLCLALIAAFACNKQTDFGADLLGNDVIPLRFDDTMSLQVINSSIDSILIFDLSTAATDNILLAGNIQDPLFGKVKSDAYIVFEPDRLITNYDPTNLTYDSLVLSLSIDPNLHYGDTLIPMNINFDRIAEDMFTDSIIYSSRTLPVAERIGSINGLQFTPRTTTITQVIDSSGTVTDSTIIPFFISTKLSDALGQELLESRIFDSIPKFLDKFKGIRISVENEAVLFAINLSGSRTKMVLHYHDSIPRTIEMVINPASKRFSHFEMDPSQALAGQYLDSTEKGEEYIALQGMAGIRPRIIFPNLDQYKGKGIKLVQLEMTIAENIPGNPGPNFREVEQIAVSAVNTGGSLTLIDDFTSLRDINLLSQFGGSPRTDLVNGVKVKRYTINMTQHFLRMVKGDETNEIMLSVLGGARRPNRVMMYGPGHSTYPLRLKIAYSDL